LELLPFPPHPPRQQAFAEADEPKNGDSAGDVLQHAAMPVCADLFPDLFDPFTTTATFSAATIEAVVKTLTEKYGKTRR
jgi:hypothetical protein